MKYKFKYETTAFDLWKLSMCGTYGSMVGLSNIIFTIAMVLLAVKFWTDVNSFLKILIILGISVFTLIQPLAVYNRSKKQIARVPKDMEIGFDDKGVHIITFDQNEDIKWKNIKGVAKKSSMIIIYSSNNNGFILTNSMLGVEKENFYKYIVSKITR